MHRAAQYFLLAVCLLVAGGSVALAGGKPTIIQIHEAANSFSLTVPASKFIMTIPKGSLSLEAKSESGTPDDPRHFYFKDTHHLINIGGWFEPAAGFTGITKYWAAEMANWKKNNLPEPHDVSFVKIGNWDAVFYDLPLLYGMTNTHLQAHWVQAGTWIDIHLSLATKGPTAERRTTLKSLLQSISFVEKK